MAKPLWHSEQPLAPAALSHAGDEGPFMSLSSGWLWLQQLWTPWDAPVVPCLGSG